MDGVEPYGVSEGVGLSDDATHGAFGVQAGGEVVGAQVAGSILAAQFKTSRGPKP